MKAIWTAFLKAMEILVSKLASIKFVVWIILTILATVIMHKANTDFAVAFQSWGVFEISISTVLFAANQTQKVTESKERIANAKKMMSERLVADNIPDLGCCSKSIEG